MRDRALIDWRTFAIIFDRKDIEGAREWAIEQGIELVDTGRRKLPTLGTIRNLIKRRRSHHRIAKQKLEPGKKLLGPFAAVTEQ